MSFENSRHNMQLVSVRTDHLRDRLNKLYDAIRGNAQTYASWGRFDYLWDLKELAVLEGKGAVQIPDFLLEELERVYVDLGSQSGRGH